MQSINQAYLQQNRVIVAMLIQADTIKLVQGDPTDAPITMP
jgi:hypothetical protein